MKKYIDVTVRILLEAGRSPGGTGGEPASSAKYRVFVDSEQGQGESTLELPFGLDELYGALFGGTRITREMTPRAASSGPDPRSPREFGEKLYESLFRGEVKSNLDKTMAVARDRKAGVRIRLSMNLSDAGLVEVASLPWELLRGPKDASPLALSIDTPLVRSLEVPEPTDPQPFDPPLRILTMISNPTGTQPLNLDAERERIEKSWKLLPDVIVDFVRPVRAELLNQLAAEEYHVFHYMGHGEFRRETGGSLLLENRDGTPDAITGEELGAYLRDEGLRLVFLNACNTGTANTRSGVDPFAGVATSLIRAGIPAVVAMQFPISDDAAISFAETFYARIAQRYPVDAAVAEARKILYSETRPEWATPVLFLRSKDGVLFEPAGRTAAPEPHVRESEPGRADQAAAPKADDPWAQSAGDGDRIFFAATNEKLRPLCRSLISQLESAGIQVASGIPPPYEVAEHAEKVLSAVRQADLCIHLLGDSAGEPLDDDDQRRTYPLEQLRIALEAARSQMVIVPEEVDLESITDSDYRKHIDELIERPRSAGRFEFVRSGRHQLADEIIDKLRRLHDERHAEDASPTPGLAMSAAFVDVHRKDLKYAQALESFLIEHNIDVTKKTSSDAPSDAISQFDVQLTSYPLYIVVSGSADKDWVANRCNAAMKSAVLQGTEAIIAEYLAPVERAEQIRIRLDLCEDSSAIGALLRQFEQGNT